MAGIFLAPLWWMLLASFQPGERAFGHFVGLLDLRTLSLQNYVVAFRRAGLADALVISGLQLLLLIGQSHQRNVYGHG